MTFLTDRMIDSGALVRRLGAGGGLGPVNLLTRQDASLEGSGTGTWTTTLCTLARSTAQAASGSASLAITSTGAGNVIAQTPRGLSGFKVTPGKVYTAVGSLRSAAITTAISVRIYWYNSAGSNISDSASSLTPLSSSAWQVYVASAVAPSTAAYAAVQVRWAAVGASEVVYADQLGLWEGAGGSWVPGGERLDPSTLGHYWDESVGRRLFVWDTINSRWQMTYGDTGWRTVTAENSWSGTVYLRRIGQQVVVRTAGVAGVSASADTFYTLPTGYKPLATYYVPLLSGSTTTAIKVAVSVGGAMSTARPLSAGVAGEFSWMTNESWPTSLPGTASGSIPNA